MHKNKICAKMAPPGDASFYIGCYREIHCKYDEISYAETFEQTLHQRNDH